MTEWRGTPPWAGLATARGQRAGPPPFEPPQEEWRRRYPLFPRLLFVLDGTGPASIDTRISALHAAARDLALSGLRDVSILAAPLVDLLRDVPSAAVWRPVQTPDRRVDWMQSRHP